MNNPSYNTSNSGYSSFFEGSYRYGFQRQEKDDEVKGKGNSYDFGARMYDPRVGRWYSRDKLYTNYISNSPYHYVLNNPIQYRDLDGNILVDPDGNIVYQKKQGYDPQPSYETSSRVTETTKKGEIYIHKTTIVTPVMQDVWIFANDGTKISASIVVSYTIEEIITHSQDEFNAVNIEQKSYKKSSVSEFPKNLGDKYQLNDGAYDCHGLTFTNGKFWINNDQAEILIEHDGFEEGNQFNSYFVAYFTTLKTTDDLSVILPSSLSHTTPLNPDGSVNSKRGKTKLVKNTTVQKETEAYSGEDYVDGIKVMRETTTKYYKYKKNKTVNVKGSVNNGTVEVKSEPKLD